MVDSPAPPLVAGDAGSERQLIDQAKAGEPAACDALARRYRRAAYLLALQMLGNRDDAMDVTQDAMLRFFSTLSSFDATRRVQPWLFTIVRNQVRDLWRQRQRRPADAIGESDALVGQLAAPQPSPEADLHRRELRQRVWRALATLSVDKRENHRAARLPRPVLRRHRAGARHPHRHRDVTTAWRPAAAAGAARRRGTSCLNPVGGRSMKPCSPALRIPRPARWCRAMPNGFGCTWRTAPGAAPRSRICAQCGR